LIDSVDANQMLITKALNCFISLSSTFFFSPPRLVVYLPCLSLLHTLESAKPTPDSSCTCKQVPTLHMSIHPPPYHAALQKIRKSPTKNSPIDSHPKVQHTTYPTTQAPNSLSSHPSTSTVSDTSNTYPPHSSSTPSPVSTTETCQPASDPLQAPAQWAMVWVWAWAGWCVDW